ncbi:MAG: malate dehydrogenase [Firmicutes bacterium HGW-Firmicutes-10]|jgi:LDH2 family malate/lactate/ureidoglycolate dehydrogenase|nr:MAG: malate dehydrogenase [Firmicutes bacterium HGW-Firmicutes-10]
MTSKVIQVEALRRFCEDTFVRLGFKKEDSTIISDVLLISDLFGIDSHGINRLQMYVQQLRVGYIDNQSQPEIVFQTPVSAVIDGMRGMGQLVSNYAMKVAINKAKTSGIGLVTVRNSNHYGIAGYYSLMASNEGMIGLSMTNSLAAVVPTYGKEPMLGTNPIAFSFPTIPSPFLFDSATSVVSVGKIEVYDRLSKPIPLGWGLNMDGNDEQNPAEVLKSVFSSKSGLHPLGGGSELFGGHKGYGFSMVVEILSSIISLGTTSNHVEKIDGNAGVCHFFAAIDPKIFGDPIAIQKHFETYLDEIRNSEKAEGQNRIYIHGEKEAESFLRRQADGIVLSEKTLDQLVSIANELNPTIIEYLE